MLVAEEDPSLLLPELDPLADESLAEAPVAEESLAEEAREVVGPEVSAFSLDAVEEAWEESAVLEALAEPELVAEASTVAWALTALLNMVEIEAGINHILAPTLEHKEVAKLVQETNSSPEQEEAKHWATGPDH